MPKQNNTIRAITEAFAKASRSYFGPKNRYDAAYETRFTSETKGVSRSGTSADFHAPDGALYFLTERARDIDRNNILVGQAIDRLCANVLGQGFELEPDVGRKPANELLKAKWSTWTQKETCDVQSEFDFNYLSYLAFRASIVDGDIVGLPLRSGALQLVESHRIRTPYVNTTNQPVSKLVVNGVQLDQQRRRVRYWITNDTIPIHETVFTGESTAYNVYDSSGQKQLFHVWHPTRATQTRGITKLAASMDFIRMYGDIHFARLVQQQAISAYTYVRTRPENFELPADMEHDLELELDPCEGSFREVSDISMGLMYTGMPGEDLKVINANVPAPTFFDHATAIEQLIALNLDLPLILMRLDASETNFSGWRGALDQAKIRFRHLQRWFALCAWHGPIYKWLLRQWTNPQSELYDPQIAGVRSQIGERIFEHEWVLPTWPYIQPEVEQKADRDALANSLTSPRRVQKARGRQWPKVVEEIVEDKVLAIETAIKAAAKLNSKYPEEVNPRPIQWSDLMTLPRPEGESVNQSTSTSFQPDAEVTDAPQ